MRDLYDRTPIKLDPEGLGLTDPGELKLARAIAEATEATREALRAREPWNTLLPPRGFQPAPRNAPAMMVDAVPWPSLLVWDGCADDAARRAGVKKDDVIVFARRLCQADQFVVLTFGHVLDVDIPRELSRAVRPMYLKGVKKRMDGRDAGRQSGAERAKKRPSPQVIAQTYKKLMRDGMTSGDAVKRIASNPGKGGAVSIQTVYAWLRKARASES